MAAEAEAAAVADDHQVPNLDRRIKELKELRIAAKKQVTKKTKELKADWYKP